MTDETKEVEKVKSSEKLKIEHVRVQRLDSGRGGIVRLRSLNTKEIRHFSVGEVNMSDKEYSIPKELWMKGS